MNDQSKGKTIDQQGNEQLDPRKALMEQSLAVELAGAEIDRAIATAHRYPRHLDVVVKKIGTLACYNEESAATCIYSLPRGSKPIIGPSIGFANIVLQSWGNCRAASQIVFIDTKQKVVIAQGAFMDLETNAQSIVPVNRRIVDKYGKLYNDDMQIVTGMAAASIARRNAILQGVPRGIWFQIWEQALGIVRGNVETFAENKDKALKAMAQFGVKPEQVFMYLGLKGEIEMTFEHIPYVRGMYQQLRDGAATVEEMFDPRRMTGKGFETIGDPLGDDEPQAKAAAGAAAAGVNRDASHDPAEGQGDVPVEQQTQPTAAVMRAEPQAQQAKPAQGPASATAPESAKAALTANPPAQKKAEPEAAAAKAPATAAEYLVYWQAWCAKATSASAVTNQFAADRNLRKSCAPFTEEEYDRMNTIRDERIAELRK